MLSQQRFIIFFLFLGLLSTSVWTLTPTPIQQFLVLPTYTNLMTKLWHIEDDIVGFYGHTERDYVDKQNPQGYLRMTPKNSQVQRILDDTIASCHTMSYLDSSYYYAAASTFLYYCTANNSLLLIDTKDYKVQDAIPVSTSQTFQEVILGRNEQGHVYILGLPDILYIPAQAPTELILVNLTTKAVENHVIFNKGSDSQKLVTGFAFDSGISYLLTKSIESGNTLIEIHQVNLIDNDYELTPFTRFTYQKESIVRVVPNPLSVLGGYLFTNDDHNLLIFDKNGSLVKNETKLDTYPFQKKVDADGAVWAPIVAAQEGGATFYAKFSGFTARAYSLQNGVINSRVLDSKVDGLNIALGNKDLMIAESLETFYIQEIQTNTTIYTSMRLYREMMVSSSHVYFYYFETLYVFDRQVPGKLLQTLTLPDYRYYDIDTNSILGLSKAGSGCQITYLNLETLAVRDGPLVNNQSLCSWNLIQWNITDPANPFFVLYISDSTYLLISPATYGVISWTPPYYMYSWPSGVIIPGDAGTSFSFVFTSRTDQSKIIKVNKYKLEKPTNRFTLQDSYNLTTIQTKTGQHALFPIFNNQVVMTYDRKITIFNLAQKSAIDYDVPTFYYSYDGVGVLYDKNKTPYLALSEVVPFGQVTTVPQLFDFTNLLPVPEAIEKLTRTAKVAGSCSYSLIDEYNDNIGVLRFYDVCDSTQTSSKIYI